MLRRKFLLTLFPVAAVTVAVAAVATLNDREWSELLTSPTKKDQPQQQQRQHHQQQDDTVDDVDADDVLTSTSTSSRVENESGD